MPAFYAHYRFGKQLLSTLPPDVKQCIHRFRRLYDMGLQGPDLFFYYNPVIKTQVGDLGGTFHRQSGQEFFTRACAQATSEAARSYLYGLLGHYCLDSGCHPYVNQVVEQGQARHIALESEFDRYLMAADGIAAPHAQDHSGKVKLTRGECVTVAAFYPPATPGSVHRSVRNMAWCLCFLSGDRDKREKLLKRIRPSLCDSLVPRESVPEYQRMDSELLARFNRCQKHYLTLLEQLTAHMADQTPLGEDFQSSFG